MGENQLADIIGGRKGEQAWFGGDEGYGLIGGDDAGVGLAAVTVDAAGAVYGKDERSGGGELTRLGRIKGWRIAISRPDLRGHLLNNAENLRGLTAQRQTQANAKERIHNHIGAVYQISQQAIVAVIRRQTDEQTSLKDGGEVWIV